MAIVQVQDLIEAGVHFGHRASRWNPKMRPYIYGKRNLIHIIDLRETVRGLLRAYKFLRQGRQPRQPGAVRRHQAAGQGSHRTRSRPLRHAVRQRTLAGRHAHQLPHHPRPAQAAQELEGDVAAAGEKPDKRRSVSLHEDHDERVGQARPGQGARNGPDPHLLQENGSQLDRELTKINRNLHGIREMNRLPDAMVVVDPKREHIAVKEAQRMGVTTVALIDTDSDPDTVDLPIPGNDDSIRSIELILAKLADAINEGRAASAAGTAGEAARPSAARTPRRRRRSYPELAD